MSTHTREEIRVGQLAIRFLVEGDESGGSVAIFEFDVPAGARVPVAHSHDAYEETIYGLEGVLTWTVDGAHGGRPRRRALIPRGVVHRFDNRTTPTRRRWRSSRPGILGPQYFREIAESSTRPRAGRPTSLRSPRYAPPRPHARSVTGRPSRRIVAHRRAHARARRRRPAAGGRPRHRCRGARRLPRARFPDARQAHASRAR